MTALSPMLMGMNDYITDLQAENDRLKTALVSIRDMLEQPNHRDVLPEMIYQTAVTALGGE